MVGTSLHVLKHRNNHSNKLLNIHKLFSVPTNLPNFEKTRCLCLYPFIPPNRPWEKNLWRKNPVPTVRQLPPFFLINVYTCQSAPPLQSQPPYYPNKLPVCGSSPSKTLRTAEVWDLAQVFWLSYVSVLFLCPRTFPFRCLLFLYLSNVFC